MDVTISAPQEFQTNVMTQINKRRGMINDSEVMDDYVTIKAEVSLSEMFGYVSDLRAATQGKGEFTMEYKKHMPVTKTEEEEMKKAYQKELLK